jgi:hypothetical protein
MSNAVPINANTGAIAGIGALQLAVLIKLYGQEGAAVVEGVDFLGLGSDVPYTNPGWLTITGGLVDVEVPAVTQSTIVNHPLAVVVVDQPGQHRVWRSGNPPMGGWCAPSTEPTLPGAALDWPVDVWGIRF